MSEKAYLQRSTPSRILYGTDPAIALHNQSQCVPLQNFPSPASEILDYLSRHPNGQDTIEGILQWWVMEACVRKWEPRIEEAVTQLVEQGYLLDKTGGDGRVFYCASPDFRKLTEVELIHVP